MALLVFHVLVLLFRQQHRLQATPSCPYLGAVRDSSQLHDHCLYIALDCPEAAASESAYAVAHHSASLPASEIPASRQMLFWAPTVVASRQDVAEEQDKAQNRHLAHPVAC